jgi:membrane protein implicated in regulation of membrane protease activity
VDPWLWWAIAAAGLVVAEILTGGALIFAMLAFGSVLAGIASAATGSVAISLAAFAGGSLLGLLGIRPVARRHLKSPREVRSGVAALVGTSAVVIEPVDGRDGRIKLAGEIWSARAFDGDSLIEPGSTVWVLEIDGATALVSE